MDEMDMLKEWGDLMETIEKKVTPETVIITGKEEGYYLKQIRSSSPTDMVAYDEDMLTKLMEMYDNVVKDSGYVMCPNDIILSKTIPVEDLVFYIGADEVHSARILFFDDWREKVDRIKSVGANNAIAEAVVGCVIHPIRKRPDGEWIKFYHPIIVLNLLPEIGTVYRTGILDGGKYKQDFLDKVSKELHGNSETVGALSAYLINVMKLWYAIQLSMLHPIVQTIYTRGKLTTTSTTKYVMPEQRKKKGKTKVKYIKKHIIKLDDFDNAFSEIEAEDKTFNRVQDIWYVTGHYRQYQKKSNKRIWIDGYWKGQTA